MLQRMDKPAVLARMKIGDIAKSMKPVLVQQLTTVLEGAQADVTAYVDAIVPDMAEAIATGQEALSTELEHQFALVAEKQNIRLNAAKAAALASVMNGAMQFVSQGIGFAISAAAKMA